MGAVWSALLVGGGLAGALFVWLLRDTGKKRDAKQERDASLGEAVAAGGDQGGSGGLITKPEHLQESNGCLVSETKVPGKVQEAAWRMQSPPGEDGDYGESRKHAPFAWLPDTESRAPSATGNSEVLRNESCESRIGEWGFQKGQETPAQAAPCFAEKLPSSNLFMDKAKEEGSLERLNSQDSADQEDWEMVSRHSSWGDIGLGGSLEAPVLSPNQGMNYGGSTLVDTRGQEVDVNTKRGAAMSSESQQVSVRFQVHYITSKGMQFIAVTGDHERLGRWNTYIPLQKSKDGLWSRSVSLPANVVVEWKFVVVENGEVTRWEECSNRLLETGHKDKMVHKCWGIH
ncbi:PREDICTED: starch-binding domain-containing protein 1 isoform X1 [Hipposideros armiger]|uniref:Starch-binding domain-containing protein 1 n=1 Tax=Hipposideros armiger TaxID=186990 RepID=A0A8B7PS51_HIPAR|nr:PREDICTED: starch-binding domain-containing protein 1 isoform X1 [Hipposideros armiger]